MNILKKIKRACRHRKAMHDMPLRLEFILTDSCNLNCKGCTHYSSMAPREMTDYDSLVRDMDYLGKVCGDGVSQVYLIGGEPLLYPQIIPAMESMRKAFPTQEVSLFTNGLLLGKMDEAFWETVGHNDVVICLTRYPINYDYDAVEALCREKGVKLKVFADRSDEGSFLRFGLDPSGRQNRYLSHFKCFNRGCVSVTDGYVYPCSISACIKHLNRTGRVNFRHRPGDRIAVSDVRSARQIRRLRDHAVPFCGYCKQPTITDYGPSARELSEWVG